MFEKRIKLEGEAHLTLVDMAGDVTLSGWRGDEVRIRLRDGGEEDLAIEGAEGGPAISARVACELHVPARTPVTIREASANLQAKKMRAELNAEQVRGNLRLSDVDQAVVAEVYGNARVEGVSSLRLTGTIYGDARLKAVELASLQNIRGNLQIKGAGQLRASRLGGNLQAREVRGTLEADRIGGNALFKGVGGLTTLDQVAGNLIAQDLKGGAQVARIGGNLTLAGELGTGCTYHFRADGNALLRLAEGANAHLTLRARGRLQSSLALAGELQEANSLTGTLGDGGAEMVVEAGGNIQAGGGEPSFAGVGEEISRQVEESLRAIDLEAIGRQVGEEMEAAMSRLRVKMETVDWDRIGHQTQRAIEGAMARMQQDMERLSEKAARRQERLERRLERTAHHQRRHAPERTEEDWEAEEADGEMAPLPDLEEERLSILRMVEQGQITPEDAELLLDALE